MMMLKILEGIDKIEKAYFYKCSDIIKQYDIAYIDFALIMFFANNKDKQTAKEFCKIRNVKPNVVSIHVDKLVNNGLIEREVDELDRRKIKLHLTPKCDDIIKDGRILQKEFYQQLIYGLNEDQVSELVKNLNIILNNINNL